MSDLRELFVVDTDIESRHLAYAIPCRGNIARPNHLHHSTATSTATRLTSKPCHTDACIAYFSCLHPADTRRLHAETSRDGRALRRLILGHARTRDSPRRLAAPTLAGHDEEGIGSARNWPSRKVYSGGRWTAALVLCI